jgi:ABC-type antimicrobial peptide transport system permease subunit
MKKINNLIKLGIIIGIILVIIISSHFIKINSCKYLKEELEKEDTIFNEFYKVVGGTLTNISEPWYFDDEQNKTTYTLTFKGITKYRTIELRTYSNSSLRYQIGKFYRFNLNNIRLGGRLGGNFLDPEMNKLELMNCK